jgi:trehalose 6-phosphate phosphatase
MEPLFSTFGRRRLKALFSSRCLLVFDFDGVLAPHRATRSGASLRPSTKRLVEQLQSHFPVAVVTGRALPDVRKRLGFTPDFVVGNHGVEGIPAFTAAGRRAARASASWLGSLRQLRQEVPGLLVDDKKFSLTVHLAGTKTPRRAKERVVRFAGGLFPLPRIVLGKKVLNLVHPESPHKGDAVTALMKRFKVKRALYVGDDRTDEDVFRLKHPGLLTIRVGKKADSSAQFYIPSQLEFDRLLRALLETSREA